VLGAGRSARLRCSLFTTGSLKAVTPALESGSWSGVLSRPPPWEPPRASLSACASDESARHSSASSTREGTSYRYWVQSFEMISDRRSFVVLVIKKWKFASMFCAQSTPSCAPTLASWTSMMSMMSDLRVCTSSSRRPCRRRYS